MWLMNDWIESQYDYNVRDGKPREEAGYDESSPDELSCYRAMYAHFMEQEITLKTQESAHLTTHGTTPKEEADLTRRSLVMRNLEIATNSHMVSSDIGHHMLVLIVDLTEADRKDGMSDCDSSTSTDRESEIKADECDMKGAAFENDLDSSTSSESKICRESDKGMTVTKATEMGSVDQSLVADDSARPFDEDIISTNASVTELSATNETELREQEEESIC